MKKLVSLVSHGAYYRNGINYNAWMEAKFSDGTTKYMGDISMDEAVTQCSKAGIDVADFKAKLDRWVKTGKFE